jgi:hypothetical protein
MGPARQCRRVAVLAHRFDAVRRVRRWHDRAQSDHGHRRSFRYACCGFHLRGRAVCANSLDVRMEQADETILNEIEQFVLHPQVVSRALTLALDELRPATGQAERERTHLDKDRRTVAREIENLTRALALGGDLRSLVSALQQAEARQAAIDTAVRALDDRAVLTPRTVLRHLIANKITLQAIEHGERRVYRYSGTFTIGGLFEGTIVQERWRPQRDSNPRYRRERPASWASGRWGRDVNSK